MILFGDPEPMVLNFPKVDNFWKVEEWEVDGIKVDEGKVHEK